MITTPYRKSCDMVNLPFGKNLYGLCIAMGTSNRSSFIKQQMKRVLPGPVPSGYSLFNTMAGIRSLYKDDVDFAVLALQSPSFNTQCGRLTRRA